MSCWTSHSYVQDICGVVEPLGTVNRLVLPRPSLCTPLVAAAKTLDGQ